MIFNLTKYNTLIENANDFLEAALRCCFNDSIKLKKYPIYDGFLEQLAKSIKKYNTELINFNE
ncbi:hypothetical protein [Spiroplasma endosymbiont of Glossina fuscipes fuscipes]|uniref:hypothetical protein n=1 Tax=Spiroplasma endosymbiont of Glossina fuscipes fuscipes TaxID=2004463 RepID=UPI003C718788